MNGQPLLPEVYIRPTSGLTEYLEPGVENRMQRSRAALEDLAQTVSFGVDPGGPLADHLNASPTGAAWHRRWRTFVRFHQHNPEPAEPEPLGWRLDGLWEAA